MADAGHKATDRIIAEMEKKLTAEYKLAENEVEEKLDDYFRRFKIKDEKWQQWVADGKKTKAQYQAWRTQQMAQGERWTALKQQIAADYQNVNQIARSTIDKTMPTVYAVNHNYGVYQIEHGGKINTSLTLFDHEAVERLMRDDPEVLPPPGKEVSKAIARGEAERWSRQKLQSVMTQGILQGESIEHLATRLADAVGESNRKAAIRNARTMATNAQNAGRYDAYKQAKDIGVDLTIEWAATLDNRTRHDHRLMHGQRREVGEPFNTPDGYEIMWPAELGKDERDLPQREIWNCRCTLLPWVKGFEGDTVKHSDKMGDMSYDEWLEARPVYNPIDLPEQKARAIRESYIREYRGGRAQKQEPTAYDMGYSTNGIEEPGKRPRRADFSSDDEYEKALSEYKAQREQYQQALQEAIDKAQEVRRFDSFDDFEKWAKQYGIEIDPEVFSSIDLRALNEASYALDDMFARYPEARTRMIELDDGTFARTTFRIGTTTDGLLSANGGFNLNPVEFGDYATGLRSALQGQTNGWLVRGDGTFSSLVRHEYGHNVQSYIEGKIRQKYHIDDLNWRNHYLTFGDFEKARSQYQEERQSFTQELLAMAGLSGSSEYSNINTMELFAEGFAEATSGSQSEFAKAFRQLLKRWY